MPYGICPNAEQRCQFSYRSPGLARLHDALQLIQAQESRGEITNEVRNLQRFTRYFQVGTHCKSCGVLLCKVLQRVNGLDEEADEYEKRLRLNHLLALTGELQARGVLPSYSQ